MSRVAVNALWEAAPCGTREMDTGTGDERAQFASLERMRDAREPFIPKFARFAEARGRRVLEIGVGTGTDFLRYARAGATAVGIDATAAGTAMTRRRLALEGLRGVVIRADAEALPFAANSFDVVYSWGVIHHTPDTAKAAGEIVRVLRPGGRACVMVYHRRSLVAAQVYVRFGLLRGRPWRSTTDLIARHVESPGTRAFSRAEAATLFESLERVSVTPVVTPYDARVTRRTFLPSWLRALIPARLGWFLVLEGYKRDAD